MEVQALTSHVLRDIRKGTSEPPPPHKRSTQHLRFIRERAIADRVLAKLAIAVDINGRGYIDLGDHLLFDFIRPASRTRSSSKLQ